jgi:hypothetical protein
MAHPLHIQERLTHRYVDSYRHLDETRHIGVVKQLNPTRSVAPTGYDDGGEWYFRVVAPTHLKHLDLTRPIRSSLSHYGCHHEYDCCGCASYHASVKRVSKREYCVRVHVSYNY